jgi:large subunit ribosomal protein L10
MTSQHPRPEKVAVVDEVADKLSAADAAIITEYRGMSVGQLAALRRQLRGAGGEYKVYKNTLARFGAAKAGVSGLDEMLVGPTGITFVTGDVAAAAKAIKDAAKTNPLLVLKGATMGGKVLTAKDVEALAELPSRDVLLSLPGAAGEDRRSVAGSAAQLRLRPAGTHRPTRSGLTVPHGRPSRHTRTTTRTTIRSNRRKQCRRTRSSKQSAP